MLKNFERLRKANVLLESPKCEFLQLKVKYLGYTLSRNGLAPDNSKVRKYKSFLCQLILQLFANFWV